MKQLWRAQGCVNVRMNWQASRLSLTNAGLAVGVQGVLLMAATHWPRVRVIARVLAAAVSIVACHYRQAHTDSSFTPGCRSDITKR